MRFQPRGRWARAGLWLVLVGCGDEDAPPPGDGGEGGSEACPVGSPACPCGPDEACLDGSFCVSSVCVPPDCDRTLPGRGCGCDDAGACVPGLACTEGRCEDTGCRTADDGVCDEPDGTGLCDEGSDPNDCCATPRNDECEVRSEGGECREGTDLYDCGGCPEAWEGDGVCDSPILCPDGTDLLDCCAEPGNGVCEEEGAGGDCPLGSDDSDCGRCPTVDDGYCDEPDGRDTCPEGSDAIDCCATPRDGVCEEAARGGECPAGTDVHDCGYCPWVGDGECDEVSGTDLCGPGTDPADCSSAEAKIFGGEPTEPCQWPSVVNLMGVCSGTLVHPRLVVYAQHCGVGFDEVWLGEGGDEGIAARVPVERCAVFPTPGLGVGDDIAFCVLAESVDQVPIVPIAMGCELEALAPGRKATLVGFGLDEDGGVGRKRAVTTTIGEVVHGEILVGGDGRDACSGDSGGPAFVRLDDLVDGVDGDGSWRVFGITSYGASCGGRTYYSMIHTNIAWLERESGLDVTPCHDVDGTWNPGPRCRDAPTEPDVGSGTWPDACGSQVPIAAPATCGPPYDGPVDEVAPRVEISTPGTGSVFSTERRTMPIFLRVDADDEDGSGVEGIRVFVDGDEVIDARRAGDRVEFPRFFVDAGTHELIARARDLMGNASESEPVTIRVVRLDPDDESDDEGCRVGRTGSGRRGTLGWLVLAAISLRRRRRRRARPPGPVGSAPADRPVRPR